MVETDQFIRSAKAEGMTDFERMNAIDLIAADPTRGDMIVGSGGCRKVRVPGKGRGKSGGYRVVTYYAAPNLPVFLLHVLSKGSRANFSDREVQVFAKLTALLAASMGPRAAG